VVSSDINTVQWTKIFMLLYVVIFIVMVIKSLANSKSTMTDVDFL